ncbi:MAG: DUF2225 domain-containing protein [Candidatus Schekmanbacteria bacterium]|nr:DUF2225 domain-containing protein [Candidatus Schekmanbacteria bacterium]
MRILVIDDSSFQRKRLADELTKGGHEPFLAESGEQGLQMMRSHAPEVIILDLTMPDMDGRDVLRAKKADLRIARIPTVLISSDPVEVHVEQALTLGANLALRKPLKPGEVTTAAEQVAELLRAQKGHGRGAELGGAKDPILSHEVVCAGCGCREVPFYRLMPRSQLIKTDPFLVPEYEPTGGYGPSNFLCLSVAVCPECLVASELEEHFGKLDQAVPPDVDRLGDRYVEALKKGRQERATLAEAHLGNVVGAALREVINRPRTLMAGLLSYRLAVTTAHARSKFSTEDQNFRLGSFYLRSARLLRELERPEDESGALRSALEFFEQSNSRVPSAKTNYVMALVLRHFGEERRALHFLTELRTDRVDFAEKATPEGVKTLRHFQRLATKMFEEIRYG